MSVITITLKPFILSHNLENLEKYFNNLEKYFEMMQLNQNLVPFLCLLLLEISFR